MVYPDSPITGVYRKLMTGQLIKKSLPLSMGVKISLHYSKYPFSKPANHEANKSRPQFSP